jgi:hypothetical protein
MCSNSSNLYADKKFWPVGNSELKVYSHEILLSFCWLNWKDIGPDQVYLSF